MQQDCTNLLSVFSVQLVHTVQALLLHPLDFARQGTIVQLDLLLLIQILVLKVGIHQQLQ